MQNYIKEELTKIQDGCSTFIVERLCCFSTLHTNKKKWSVGITKEIDAKYFCERISIWNLSFVWI